MKASFSVSIHIDPEDLKVGPGPLNGKVGQPFSGSLPIIGGVAPFQVVDSQGVPPGLSLGPDGSFSGTPLQAGDFTVSGDVADAQG